MPVHTSVGYRRNRDTITSDEPSPAIWHRLPIAFEKLQNRRSWGIAFHDDFSDFPLIGTQTTEIGHGKYKVFNTGSGTVAPVSAVNSVEGMGRVLSISLDTNNDSGSIAQAYPAYFMSGSVTTGGPILFECCYAQNSIVTNLASTFFGLAEVDQMTLATAVPLNGGDATTNTWSGIGFRIEEDGLGVVDTVYTDRATSFTNIGDTEGGTLAANTFDNFGFVYDPEETTNCVTFYKNNQPLTTKLSRSTLTGLTNLDANPLGLIWASVADSAGTSFAGYMKWWRVVQLNPGVRLQAKASL